MCYPRTADHSLQTAFCEPALLSALSVIVTAGSKRRTGTSDIGLPFGGKRTTIPQRSTCRVELVQSGSPCHVRRPLPLLPPPSV